MAAVVHCEQLRFQSTHPVWGGTPTCISTSCKRRFQSTHPVWGGTRNLSTSYPRQKKFQSTHPVWGGTMVTNLVSFRAAFQSTHPVWGGTAPTGSGAILTAFQSTHPVWGGTCLTRIKQLTGLFQSTHPVWGGTLFSAHFDTSCVISIHPPRVGWDRADVPFIGGKYDFNPPTPCGVGRARSRQNFAFDYFNPPTPCGVGLGFLSAVSSPERFQSTHPVWGGTALLSALGLSDQFQSTHPVWGGTLRKLDTDDTVDISIHPPRVGWDCSTCPQRRFSSYFNPPTPCGVGRAASSCCRKQSHFNPPTPCGVGRRCSTSRRSSTGFQSTHPVWGGTAIIHKVNLMIYCIMYNDILNLGILPAFSAAARCVFPRNARFFRCEPAGVFPNTPLSHRHTIRTPSAL